MSKVFNMVGGGGGKNISSIVITGLKSTDTVTCTKDGKTYPATWDDIAQHWEIVGLPLGTFIVTATNGSKTTTETVLIDIVGVYEIEMLYGLWLYRDGDEFEDITGGWDKRQMTIEGGVYSDGQQYLTLSKNAGSMNAVFTPNIQAKTTNISPKKPVDVTSYTRMCVQMKVNSAIANSFFDFCIANQLTNNPSYKRIVTSGSPSSTWKAIFDYDITNFTGEKYIYFLLTATDPTSIDLDIYKVWLE